MLAARSHAQQHQGSFELQASSERQLHIQSKIKLLGLGDVIYLQVDLRIRNNSLLRSS
jgi:hypothetical protein